MTAAVERHGTGLVMGNDEEYVEVFGPHSNQYKILICDIDGSLICLLPRQAKIVRDRIDRALAFISGQRKGQAH